MCDSYSLIIEQTAEGTTQPGGMTPQHPTNEDNISINPICSIEEPCNQYNNSRKIWNFKVQPQDKINSEKNFRIPCWSFFSFLNYHNCFETSKQYFRTKNISRTKRTIILKFFIWMQWHKMHRKHNFLLIYFFEPKLSPTF